MLRKLIIAAATLATLSGPALAANWYIIRPLAGGAGQAAETGYTDCMVVDRKAGAGEQQVAGPFSSQPLGINALDGYAACELPQHRL